MLTHANLKELLSGYSEVELIELLKIDSLMLLDRFSDLIEQHHDNLVTELEEIK